MSFFAWSFKTSSGIVAGFPWPVYTLAKEKEEGRRRREERRVRRREKERKRERREKRGRF